MSEQEMSQTNQNDEHWRYQYAWWLPKGSVRALVFVGCLIFLGVFACMIPGKADTIIGAFIVIAKTAADQYFQRKDEPKS